MRKVVLYIAMSLDGYIADREGNVDWIGGQGDEGAMIDTYPEFAAQVDTVVMGWRTYHQIVTELSPDRWVYDEMTSYVVTHRKGPSTEKVRFFDKGPCSLIRALKEEAGKDIWICGGADIVGQLMEEDLIDVYHITLVPLLLGEGIRLFGETGKRIPLRLTGRQSYDGMTELVYERRVEHGGCGCPAR